MSLRPLWTHPLGAPRWLAGLNMSNPVPLFLLNTVLMPGGVLPLRVFEPRYLDMLAGCMRDDKPFAVVAIAEGSEVGDAAEPMSMGTLATIADWDQGDDGLLQVVALGGERVRLLSTKVQPDGLTVAEVQCLPIVEGRAVGDDSVFLSQGLERLLDKLGAPYSTRQRHLDDSGWVSSRLTELLPMPLPEKQALLEESDPQRRLQQIARWVRERA